MLQSAWYVQKRIINGEESTENRYFITSLTDLKKFSDAARKHWGIENSLHWCLDMNFYEDRCHARVDNSGENLAVIRHISLNLYKAFTSVKISMKVKRFRCSFDDDFSVPFLIFSCSCPGIKITEINFQKLDKYGIIKI